MNKRILVRCAIFATALPLFSQQNYLGFDKNIYPGDDFLPALHKTFGFTGYWLNNPPGMNTNPWSGKRTALRTAGFGFLILYNGRVDAELKKENPVDDGIADAMNAAHAAKVEGFPRGAIIFIDQEEGGRLLPEQVSYLRSWIQRISGTGYRPGVYCSGIRVGEGKDRISTAEEVSQEFPAAMLWVANDQCPPAPGCSMQAIDPSRSGFSHALIWQFAQSPRRPFAEACKATYVNDNCYPPGIAHSDKTFVDLDTSGSADPSNGR